MSRRDHEPVVIAEFRERRCAEEAWSRVTDAGIAAAVITHNPPWGPPIHRLQVERTDAASALEWLNRRP